MHFVRYTGLELKTRGVNHRVGSFRYKELGEGTPGTPGNYNLRLVWSETDFFSPRHMHNFDQVRVQMQGTFRFDADGTMKPGVAAYFPEGTPYGPQTSQQDTVQLVMQIGGPSGAGYLSEAQRVAAVAALAVAGAFRDGKYFAPGKDGTGGTDGFQAAWEHAQGRKMVYPTMRLQKPLFTNPEAFGWTAVADRTGAARKQLWRFGSDTVGLDMVRLDAGASVDIAGPVSCFIEHGAGTVHSDGADHDYAAYDTVHAASGEAVTWIATAGSVLIVFVHPQF
jgi:hypothetical protein